MNLARYSYFPMRITYLSTGIGAALVKLWQIMLKRFFILHLRELFTGFHKWLQDGHRDGHLWNPRVIYKGIMNVQDDRYEELNLDQRLIKILRCNRLVKTQVASATNQAFRPTANNQPRQQRNAKKSAGNHPHRSNPKDEILGSTNPSSLPGCPHCRDSPPEEKCIRKLLVHANKNPNWLSGIIVTDALEGDRMRPKVTLLNIP
jgi:hypothetical protein